MGRNTQYYSQGKNSVIIVGSGGSRVIKDFAEGESITWEPSADRISVTEGLDNAAISIASAKSGKMTINLKATSADCGYLNKIVNKNKTNPQLYKVSIISGTEERITLINAGVHTKSASGSGDVKMSNRSFEFIGTELTFDESEG